MKTHLLAFITAASLGTLALAQSGQTGNPQSPPSREQGSSQTGSGNTGSSNTGSSQTGSSDTGRNHTGSSNTGRSDADRTSQRSDDCTGKDGRIDANGSDNSRSRSQANAVDTGRSRSGATGNTACDDAGARKKSDPRQVR